MKKMRKIFAVLLTLAMVLAMSMTAFAAEVTEPVTSYSSKITVTGLSSQEEETVSLYAAITLNVDKNEWIVADWAKKYIKLSENGKKYEITDAAALAKAVSAQVPPFQQKHVVGETQVEFPDVPVGAYVVTASGVKITYSPMVAETYKDSETYMQAKDVTLVAKSTGYDVKKEAQDGFVKRGEKVTFKITTTFPSFETADSKDNNFKIIDTPTGLDIKEITSVEIGNAPLTAVEDYTTSKATNGEYTIEFTQKTIGTTNANAGKTVVVQYKAIVTSEEGYTNTANTFRKDVNMGNTEVKGYTGTIKLTKYAENGTTVLKGAEFKLYKGSKTDVKEKNIEALKFVKISDDVYKLALDTDEDKTSTLVSKNGVLTVKGLDEGEYWFEETKAPEGYSINTNGATATITENKTQNVTVNASLTDSKLSALPSTGGIGTTIFTIAGCLIMVTAAGLFFASRKKANK